jgi:hypothetical protein
LDAEASAATAADAFSMARDFPAVIAIAIPYEIAIGKSSISQ